MVCQIAIGTNQRCFPPNAETPATLHNSPSEQSTHQTHWQVLERLDRHVRRVKVQLSPTRIEVHIASADEERAPKAGDGFPKEIEADDERRGEVFLEKGVGTWGLAERLEKRVS